MTGYVHHDDDDDDYDDDYGLRAPKLLSHQRPSTMTDDVLCPDSPWRCPTRSGQLLSSRLCRYRAEQLAVTYRVGYVGGGRARLLSVPGLPEPAVVQREQVALGAEQVLHRVAVDVVVLIEQLPARETAL